ncbi:VWA domain-containing protein, partial [bacterium]|nr:VWA domain-containing protein [bacterium]
MWHSMVSWLLGIERGEIARGAGVRLRFATPWPTWVLFLSAALAAWLVFTLYRREAGTATVGRKRLLAVLRLALIAIVVIVLAKPILVVDKSELKQAYVVFLLDDSLSMSIRDRYEDPAIVEALAKAAGLEARPDGWVRADLVNGVLANPEIDVFSPLEGRCKLTVANFSDTVRGLRRDAWKPEPGQDASLVTPQGDRTLLGAALRQVSEGLRGHRIAAMVVVTDGRTQDADPTVVETARALATLHAEPFPVFTVGVGAVEEARDIHVVRILGPRAARKDDQVTLNAVVTTQGFEGEVDVLLHRGDGLVATVRTRLEPSDGPQTVPITFTPETEGTFQYRISIPAQPDETNADNNLARHPLTVKDQKSKLLLVAAQPTYFYRYLKNALVVDPSIQLSCMLQSADPDFHQEGNIRITHYPETRKELFAYDVVIFADVDPGTFRPE